MDESQGKKVTTGVRERMVDRSIELLKARQPGLAREFLVELRGLLSAETVPKAERYLELYAKQIGNES